MDFVLLRVRLLAQFGQGSMQDTAKTDRAWQLAVTYANDKLADGVGGQLQRIYGIYAISRLIGLPYFHSPIVRVGYQGLLALENNSLRPNSDFYDAFNALLGIRSDIDLPEQHNVVEIHNATLTTINELRQHADARSNPTLARISLPYGITDQNPDSYEVCKAISPFAHHRKSETIRIAVHVRRGEIFANAPARLLPNSYYIKVAQNILGILEREGLKYQIELHTEVSTKEIVIPPGHPLVGDGINAPVIINSDLNRIGDFDELPRLIKRINEPAIDCLSGIATADIIVMSRSSFSYVAALLSSSRSIVILYPFWHAAMSSWISANEEGSFDESRFITKLENLR
jgi:hypothetical protein